MAKNEVVINKKSELSRLRKEERALKGTVSSMEKASKQATESLKGVQAQIAAVEKLTADGAAPAGKKSKADKPAKADKKSKKADKAEKSTKADKKSKKADKAEKPAKADKKAKKADKPAKAKSKKNDEDFDDFDELD